MKRLLCLVFLTLSMVLPAMAVAPDEMLDDPALEQRAREISAGLRCLVCQNQSIDDSDADLARDLRLLVRERLVAGDSDAAVEQYLVDRYGEYVLLNPRFSPHTLILWIAAPILLTLGLVAIWRNLPRRAGVEERQGLSDAERSVLAELERDRRQD